MAEVDVDVFTAQFEAGVRHTIAEFGVEYSNGRVSEQVPGVCVRSARRYVGTVVAADASGKAGEKWRRKIQLACIGERIVELPKVSLDRSR